jgi:hypothetical protein
LSRYSGLMPSHTRPWQNRYRTMSFYKMNQKPRIERKNKVSRFQTILFWRHLKWCHLPFFTRSLRRSSSLLRFYFAAWRNRFTLSWSDCVGFPHSLGCSETGSDHRINRVTEAAWVHETSLVEAHSDARRGLILSFYWSRINLAQSRRWRSTKGDFQRGGTQKRGNSREGETHQIINGCFKIFPEDANRPNKKANTADTPQMLQSAESRQMSSWNGRYLCGANWASTIETLVELCKCITFTRVLSQIDRSGWIKSAMLRKYPLQWIEKQQSYCEWVIYINSSKQEREKFVQKFLWSAFQSRCPFKSGSFPAGNQWFTHLITADSFARISIIWKLIQILQTIFFSDRW